MTKSDQGPIDEELEFAILKELLHQYRQQDILAVTKVICDFVEKLREKYPNHQDYKLYHLLVGGSAKGTQFDFPDEDSIAKFIEQHSKFGG
ncbi:MAG: hypothetical protein WCW02_00700 [Candidatus Buchananbacteria bacterium]